MPAWLGLASLILVACVPPVEAIAPGNGIDIPSEGFVHQRGTAIVDGAGEELLPRCVNVDAWLRPIPYLVSDAPSALLTSPTDFESRLGELVDPATAEAFWEDWRDVAFTEADVERIEALGFSCVRLVLYHRAITRESADGPLLHEPTMERIDDALRWGLAHDVYMVLDLHTAPGGQNSVATVADIPEGTTGNGLWVGPDAADNQEDTVAIWRQLAARYRDHREVLAYDLLNEPALRSEVADRELPDLYGRILEAVREEDGNHLVFVEGDDLAHDFSAFDPPIEDDNLGYSFHAYALTPLSEWTKPQPRDLEDYLSLRDRHDRPLWLGEFGEERQAWQVDVIELMEAESVGWALYPWKRKQTWFFNPVLQRANPTPDWYAVGRYLTGDDRKAPSPSQVEQGLAEVLEALPLDACTEDGALANALIADRL